MSFWKRIFGKSKDVAEIETSNFESNAAINSLEVSRNDNETQVQSDLSDSAGNFDSNQQESIEVQNEESERELKNVNASEDSTNSTELKDETNPPIAEIEPEVGPEEENQPDLPGETPARVNHIIGMPLPNMSGSNALKPPTPASSDSDSKISLEKDTELEPETEEDRHDHLEDLRVLQGQILPQLDVPEWRDELKFVEERYEPCDLANHIVKVSKRRLISRRIEMELAESRLTTYQRYLERASRRFKDKVDENNLLNDAAASLSQWQVQQSKSVAWRLVDRVNQEILKAESAEKEATSYIDQNKEFSNPKAIEQYRHFSRRVFLIPIVGLYLASVIGLTYSRFEWILKFFPLFNLGLTNLLIMVAGVCSGFWLSNLWRYSREVMKIQKKLKGFKDKHETQYRKIKHSVIENARLSQQGALVEGKLEVLAKAYRVQLQSDVSVKAHATTFFDPNSLPACVTLARAVDNDEVKMARLKRRALSVLMSPGWRTKGLDDIARIHADSKMLDSNSLSLKSLDTDSVVSAKSAQRVLLEAFGNLTIHDRVSKSRLAQAIRDLHFQVLAKWDSDDRPKVVSLRDDGFNKLSFRSSWLVDEDNSEDWIEFLSEILTEETAPFGTFNIFDKGSILNKPELIESIAVVPNYFPEDDSARPKRKRSPLKDVMPMDVVVRVDVSPWAEPGAFAVFAKGEKPSMDQYLVEETTPSVGGTSV